MTRSFSWAPQALVVAFAVASAGCRDSSEPAVPGTLQVVAGDGQTAIAGAVVPVPPSVRLLSTRGQPMSGVTVNFASSGDGLPLPAQRPTNSQGIATLSSWTLPRQAGSHQLTVSTNGVSPLVLTATASPGAASRLAHASLQVQSGTVATAVGIAPNVLVTDQNDNPVAGATVSFSPSGNGSVVTSLAVSDANGIAGSGGWTLGTGAGQQTLSVTLPGSPGVPAITFAVSAAAAAAAGLAVTTQPSTTNAEGAPLLVQPVVEVRDNYGNRVLAATQQVTASIAAGSAQTLSGTVTIGATNGRATFTDLVVHGEGTTQLHFTTPGLTPASSAAFNVPATAQCAGLLAVLDFVPGQMERYLTSQSDIPACFDFTLAASAGHEYLVQIENISLSGNSDTGLFPGAAQSQNGFTVSVATGAIPDGNVLRARVSTAPADAVHAWDFGSGPIYEIEPREPTGDVQPVLFKRGALRAEGNALTAAAAVGDTIVVFMEGIPRLNIPSGQQRAVVRYVGTDLIFAEDVRLSTLTRQSGGTNTPLTMSDMTGIAADYAQYAKVQADLFFQGRHNAMTEANGGQVIAVHSLMYADNIWGYTYPNSNYFVWDFWAGTDGSTRGVNQRIERNANNLFMHEIAHMRHFGMSERAGRTAQRGNRWLVEGFARASERWPVVMRLTGITNFSRTGNIVLPSYTTASLNSLEDVPVYTQASVSLYGGYAASSYLFDYFADQVARTTAADWRVALGEFLVHAGVAADLNTTISTYLPGLDIGTLLTRSRIALFLDDYANGLADWTQFHQFQLRASRQTANPQLDPRNLWPRIVPGTTFQHSREIGPGGAFAYIIDGAAATSDARVLLQFPRVAYGALSITRVR